MPRCELRVVGGEDKGRSVPLPDRTAMTVGRGKDCGLCLDDAAMSRVHFSILLEDDICSIEDLDSHNGTFINGLRLRGAQILQHLDLITAGRHQLTCLFTSDCEPTVVDLGTDLHCQSCGCPIDRRIELALGMSAIGPPVCTICRQLDQTPEKPSAHSDTVISPQQLGPYLLHGSLGGGTTGIVYRALDTRTEQWVALKLMMPRDMKPKIIQRFLEEARITASLDHPGIVRCHQIGHLEQMLFIALEYHEGGDLESWLHNVGLPERKKVLDWGVELCEALTYAHERGVIHRDLKPANILLGPAEELKIIDFGLSRALDHAGLRLTQTCNILGTPQYMSPEQIDNVKQADHRTDIYAVGVILFRLLAGASPFRTDRNNLMQLYRAKLDGETYTLHQLCDDLSPSIAEPVHRAMAPDPSKRHQSAVALADDLREARGRLS